MVRGPEAKPANDLHEPAQSGDLRQLPDPNAHQNHRQIPAIPGAACGGFEKAGTRMIFEIKMRLLRWLVILLESACCLLHWMPGWTCKLAVWSERIDRHYNIGVWKDAP